VPVGGDVAGLRRAPEVADPAGYARCSTGTQHLTAQRDRLRELGVAEDRIYLDHGLTGTSRARPGLGQALAIGGDLAARGIKLSLGGQVYDPTDPMGKMFSTSSPPSPSSRSTCCGCASARAWPWPRRRGSSPSRPGKWGNSPMRATRAAMHPQMHEPNT